MLIAEVNFKPQTYRDLGVQENLVSRKSEEKVLFDYVRRDGGKE